MRSVRWIAGLALVAACAHAQSQTAGGTPHPDDHMGHAMPAGGQPEVLYVAVQGASRVLRIDMRTNTVMDTIDLERLGFSHTAQPHDIAVLPDGSAWFVSLIGDNKVVKLDRENRVLGTATMEVPGMMHLLPDASELYVTRSSSAVNPPPRVGVVETRDMAIDELDVFFPRPHAVAMSHAGDYAYIGSLGENKIGVINTRTQKLDLAQVEGPIHSFVQFAISHDGRTMVASAQLTHQIMVFDISHPPAVRLIKSIPVNAQPWHPVFSRDGHYVYVGNYAANTVTIIDMDKMEVARVVSGEGIAEPYVAYVSPDDRYLYVSNRNLKGSYVSRTNPGQPVGTVVVIDPRAGTIVKVIETPASPTGMSSQYGH